MHRLVQVAALAALLCCAGPAGSVSASTIPAQLTSPATQLAEAPKSVAPQREDESPPGQPAAISPPVADERTSEAVIVLLGTALGVVGMVGFQYTGRWMHRRATAKAQSAKT